MKITKTSDRASFLKMAKQNAIKGCNKCPCCGEAHNGFTPVKSWVEGGFFKKEKHLEVKCYTCRSCGAEWESEPYEWV